MTRQEANRKILSIIAENIELYPDMRFSQLLEALNVVQSDSAVTGTWWVDEFYLESEELLKRLEDNKKVSEE